VNTVFERIDEGTTTSSDARLVLTILAVAVLLSCSAGALAVLLVQ